MKTQSSPRAHVAHPSPAGNPAPFAGPQTRRDPSAKRPVSTDAGVAGAGQSLLERPATLENMGLFVETILRNLGNRFQDSVTRQLDLPGGVQVSGANNMFAIRESGSAFSVTFRRNTNLPATPPYYVDVNVPQRSTRLALATGAERQAGLDLLKKVAITSDLATIGNPTPVG